MPCNGFALDVTARGYYYAGLPSSVRLASQHLRSPPSRQLTYFARDTSTALA